MTEGWLFILVTLQDLSPILNFDLVWKNLQSAEENKNVKFSIWQTETRIKARRVFQYFILFETSDFLLQVPADDAWLMLNPFNI